MKACLPQTPAPRPRTSALIAGFLRVLTGVIPRWAAPLPEQEPVIFYANHSSHLDAILLWALLPAGRRAATRPVAARDYWLNGRVRRFLACRVFNVVLVTRGRDHFDADAPASARDVHQSLTDMSDALASGQSLILFPEGTRGAGDTIGPFKSGLYHLARLHPGAWLVPVYLENLNRILPKGEHLMVPLIGNVSFGAPFRMGEAETKTEFLNRAHAALEALKGI